MPDPTPTPAAPPPESLSGLVDHLVFQNEESGFFVARVNARGHRAPVTVVGTLPALQPGEWMEAAGAWVMDPRHGRQFQASDIKLTRPDTLEGIEKYLGSGMIRGIGPVYAAKLVAAFGKDIFDIIEKKSARLLEVDGIGRLRRDMIKAAWDEQKHVRDIMAFLFSQGVSTARAFRIYKIYGDKSVEKIRLDPYCLARDIHGIGFLTADRVAARLGIARDSDLRARAGVEYVLNELTGQGHCAYPRAELAEETARILEMSSEIVERAIQFGIEEKRLVERPADENGPLVFLTSLDFAERELARRLITLTRRTHPLHPIRVDAALAWAEEKSGLTFDPRQRDAVKAALENKTLIITGGPGVGKTTLVRAILNIFRARRKKTLLCAPTGRAAKRLQESCGCPAKTIHRTLIYDPQTHDFKYNAERSLDADLVVVDEVSMLDVTLAWQLVRAVPAHAALVLVGDADQLPSVGPGRVLGDLIESGVLPVARLNHIFRQAAASQIVTNAHRINAGEMPELPPAGAAADTAAPRDFFFFDAEDPARAAAQVVRLVRAAIPQKFRLDPWRDIQVLTPMQRGELGARNLNVLLQQALNHSPDEGIERFGARYRTGDKVMQVMNNYDKDVYNGDIGRIERIHSAERELVVRFDDRLVKYDLLELDELAPAYAITIHKSQGSEYPCVVIPLHTQHFVLLERNLVYTAITRGKKLVVLVGTRKALALAVKRAHSARRVTLLPERLRREQEGLLTRFTDAPPAAGDSP